MHSAQSQLDRIISHAQYSSSTGQISFTCTVLNLNGTAVFHIRSTYFQLDRFLSHAHYSISTGQNSFTCTVLIFNWTEFFYMHSTQLQLDRCDQRQEIRPNIHKNSLCQTLSALYGTNVLLRFCKEAWNVLRFIDNKCVNNTFFFAADMLSNMA